MDSDLLAAVAAGNLAICLSAMAAELSNHGKIQKRKVRRSCWINPERELKPHLDLSVEALFSNFNLCNEYEVCKTYTLMDEALFRKLLSVIEKDIKRVDTPMRKSVQVEAKLAAVLSYLSTDEKLSHICEQTNLSSSYLNMSLSEVCSAIYNNLKSQYLICPNTETGWQRIASEYEGAYNFPMCLGALDCMHIQFNATRAEKLTNKFLNCYGTQSIYLIALVDANGKFIAIDVGQHGSDTNEEAFEKSKLLTVLNDIEKLKSNQEFPYVVLTEKNFKTSPNLVSPYPMRNQKAEEKEFNRKHCDAYNTVNDAFETMRHNFKVFNKLSTLYKEKAITVVLCCCLLHNYLLEKKSPWYTKVSANREDTTSKMLQKQTFHNKASNKNRDLLKQYFAEIDIL